MLVYGDPRFAARLSVLAGRLRRQVEEMDADELEELRPLAVQAGQLEQGLFDRFPQSTSTDQRVLRSAVAVSDLIAQAFYLAWAKAAGADTASAATHRELLREAARVLADIALEEDPELTIKIPEGFQFYALFPEQYCASALKWAADHAGTRPKQVLVVGIRSIGTTLSAVVKAALRAAGWPAERVTVRPTGHPFQRMVAWEQTGLRACFRCALVVDEGPGLSGSSMAAVAQAMAEAGAEDISFFPGHAGEPGSAASAEVQRWWKKAPRYLTTLEDLRWDGLSLKESLARQCDAWRVPRDAALDISSRTTHHASPPTNLSGGLWRQSAFIGEAEWPAVCATFERMKFKCADGNGRGVLWKFAGLGCAGNGAANSEELEKIADLAEEGWVPKPLGVWRGFSGMPWIEGRRLQAQEGHKVWEHLGKYLARVKGPPLAPTLAQAGVARLAEMLYWNTREALGEAVAEQCRPWAEAVSEMNPGPSYGDGHMGPWEWVRTPAGQLLKTDCTGHTLDHTLVGEQSVLWDVAGTLVEWGLEARAAAPLLCPLQAAGVDIKQGALGFYELAYAAFRMGITSLGASQLGEGEPERVRLLRASDYYRDRIQAALRCNSRTEKP